MSFLKSVFTVGGLTAASRVFGFIRDTLMAAFLGAGPVADAFFVALRFPNLFRSLFAEGAFSASFIPIFVGILNSEGRAKAIAFAENTLSMLCTILFVFVLVFEILMGPATLLLAPGFHGQPQFALAVEFSRITFPYLLFISLTALQGGLLNSLGKFAAPAATPILLNLSLITVLVGAGGLFPTLGHALSWGVFVAGIVQFLWLLRSCAKNGISLRLPWPKRTPETSRLLRRAVPVAIGAGVYQVNIMAGTVFASLLPAGSVSFLFYADRVNQLPYGIIGVAISTALLPILSRQVRAGGTGALHTQDRALEIGFFLTLPAAAALITLARPIISVLFERGQFGVSAVDATATALAAYAVGLPAFMLIKSLTPGFYAREDTKTPVRIAFAAAVANVSLSSVLMQFLGHVGIALAVSLSAWLNALLLGLVLRRRGFLALDKRFRRRVAATVVACALMVAALVLVRHLTPGLGDDGFIARALNLTLLIAVGSLAFTLSAALFGAFSLSDIKKLVSR